jgi:hypothetical protein
VFQIGKGSTGYLVATDRSGANPLGGIGGEAARADICPAYGGSAFLAPRIFVACTTGVHGVELDTSGPTPSMKVGWRAQVAATGPPVVVGSVVWSTDPADQTLFGLDATTGQVVSQRTHLGPMTRFSTPTAIAGGIVVATGSAVTAVAT